MKKSITIQAANDLELASKLELAAIRIRTTTGGGNWKLTRRMKAMGLTDRMIADALKETRQSVYNWRRGLRRPNAYSMDQLTAFMKATPEELGFPNVRKKTPAKKGKTGLRDRQLGQDAEMAAKGAV